MRRQHPSRVAGGDPGLEHLAEMVAHRALLSARGALAQGRGRADSWRRRALVWPLRIVAGIVAMPLALFPRRAVPRRRSPPTSPSASRREGVTIYVRSNGVHTWIVMPKVNAEMDWRPYARPAHLRDPRWGAADHVAIGYGNREFYLNTPTWGDLTAAARLRSPCSAADRPCSTSSMSTSRGPRTGSGRSGSRRDQYRRLAGFIQRRFRLDAGGRPIPVLGRGYGADDMFYEANGGYSASSSPATNGPAGRCAQAGVRIGLWTPFEQSIMWRLD